MASEWQGTALSEVIGFILILAIITAAASLYIVYVVPAQGREAEIRHMEYISGEFTGYKIGIDSLWINNREDVTISRTFDLGTLGATTQGSFLNLPLFQPYGSGGTMVVNGRGDTIEYEVDALVEGFGTESESSPSLIDEPKHLYVKLSIDEPDDGGELLLEPSEGDWEVWLNVTQMITSAESGTIDPLPEFEYSPSSGWLFGNWWDDIEDYLNDELVPWSESIDISFSSEPVLTITVIKNGNETLSNWVIRRNIDDSEYYTIDIFDEAYGLSGDDLSYPFSIDKTEYGIDCLFLHNIPEIVESGPIPMGSLEYRSNNNYWIQQNYYYQDGAVFLEQPDDGSVVKVLPSITLTKGPSGTLIVRIIDIAILSDSRSLGGTGSVEVTSFVSEVTEGETVDGTRFATGIPNAKNIVVNVTADDEPSALAWEGAFKQIRTIGIQRNEVPEAWIDLPTRTGNRVTFRIDGDPTNPEYDILLDYIRVNMSASLQSVAV